MKVPEIPKILPVSKSLPTVATPRMAPPMAACAGWKLSTTSDIVRVVHWCV